MLPSSTFALLLSCVPQGTGSSLAPVVINEFQYDDTNVDDREYVELFNRSSNTIDISGWLLDSRDQSGPNVTYTVAPGTILAPGGYWVIGAATVSNVNQVVGATNLWENDMDTLTLRDSSGAIIDSLVYEVNKASFVPVQFEIENEGIWGNFVSTDGIATAWSRCPDGWDDDNNGFDFYVLPSTPGQTNAQNAPMPYNDNFDAAAPETTLPGWAGSFSLPYVIDPTVVSTHNPNVIPPSPQGGNAAAFWDSSGGGNLTIYTAGIKPGQVLQAWVYFDATPQLAGEHETWSIGFGPADSFYNTPDPSGTLGGLTANGNVNVSVTYQVTSAGATLYVVNHNDGGWGANAKSPPRIPYQIPVQPGVNDGWQILRFEMVDYSWILSLGSIPLTAVQNVGNAEQCCDEDCNYNVPEFGKRFPCTTCTSWPDCGGTRPRPDFGLMSYRELVANNTTLRPLTLDDLIIRPSSASVSLTGTASPTTIGTPTLRIGSPPIIGNSLFSIDAHQLRPSSAGALLLSASPQTFDLGQFGGPPGANVLLNFISVPVTASAQGEASLPLGIPNSPALVGGVFYTQDIDLDLALPYPIPVGTSQILSITIGGL